MGRVKTLKADQTQGTTQTLLQGLEKKLGHVPNIYASMANSAAMLEAMITLSELANKTSLSPQIREEIALIVGQANQCNYCLSAHTAIAKSLGLSENTILAARKGESLEEKTKAILWFAKLVVDRRGLVDEKEIETLKTSGVTDTELVDIMLIISMNMMTNYFNHVVNTDVDFPPAPQI